MAGWLGARLGAARRLLTDRRHSYSYENSPIQKELAAIEVGNVAAFLVSPLSSAVTGHVMFVDNGLNVMGLAPDSKTLLDRS